jgi:hypothetical protein
MLVLAMEFSRGTTGGAVSASPGRVSQRPAEAGVRCFFGRRQFAPSKRNRGSPGADAAGARRVSPRETIAYDGDRRGGRQASDQLGVPLTDVRGSNSLERR